MEILSDIEVLTRLSVAVLFGALLGVERTLAGKRAGMRTYALVSLGSALFVLVSILITGLYADTTTMDPTRIASQILVGIGFIGAGLVVYHHDKLSGLTSAAGLWVAAGVGMASGFGLYTLGFLATALTLFVFTIMWLLESFIRRFTYNRREE